MVLCCKRIREKLGVSAISRFEAIREELQGCLDHVRGNITVR
jgi:hypothetical protein